MRMMLALTVICSSISAGVASRAEETREAVALTQEISARIPSDWQVHVSWRDNQLVAFVTPPYQQAFDLWYEPEKLRAKMLSLCPSKDDSLWRLIGQDKQVAVEPTVGGKSDVAMRLTCPRGAKTGV